MLVKGDTPVCSGSIETTTTDKITSTTICDTITKSTVLNTVNTDFHMVVECEDDPIEPSAGTLQINDGFLVPSKLTLETVSEEQEIVR